MTGKGPLDGPACHVRAASDKFTLFDSEQICELSYATLTIVALDGFGTLGRRRAHA